MPSMDRGVVGKEALELGHGRRGRHLATGGAVIQEENGSNGRKTAV
jgi:hypothetical protein